MLTLLVGTPGSGKTLFAIDKIIKINSGEAIEFKNVEIIYNNISGFKFDKYVNSTIQNVKFDFNKFYIHLKILYSLYLQNENKDNVDDILINYCKENNIFNAYFIIDEAHNFFDNQDKVKSWWFTYHRHLNHEILLITQNKTLINTTYRNIPELFIRAEPRSKAIFSGSLRYFNYTDYRMSQKFSITEIKLDTSYFDLYTSGNVSSQKLQGRKLLIFFVVVVVFCILIFSYLIYTFIFSSPTISNSNQTIEKSYNDNTIQNNYNKPISNNNHLENLENKIEDKLFKFTCFSSNCYIQINNKLHFIPYEILRNYTLQGKNIYLEKKSKRLNVFLTLPEDTFNFLILNQGVRNEKNFIKSVDVGFPNISSPIGAVGN